MMLPNGIRALLDRIVDPDRAVQGAAFAALCAATERRVGWAETVWDELVVLLDHRNNRTRAIAGQLLARLAISMPAAAVMRDLPRLIAATTDPQFVTGRHILQALAHLAATADPVPARLVDLLAVQFADCAGEKNAASIRHDIQTVLRAVHDRTDDDTVRRRALDLAMLEADADHRRTYLGCWR